MITIYDRTGTSVVARSKSLRGVIKRAGLVGLHVARLDVQPDGSYRARFYFFDGSYCACPWADWRVFLDWCSKRKNGAERVTLPETFWHEATKENRLAAIRKQGTIVTMA